MGSGEGHPRFPFVGQLGQEKTMQLEVPKREFLLAILHKWLRTAATSQTGVRFVEFESVVQKVWHAFMSIPSGGAANTVQHSTLLAPVGSLPPPE